ncbi:MAG: 2,5-diamino-6-ribosylamino-4(3H)-pyrimidinone 5'-phosphate reductase [bacterium ADurb.Bin212]|nr:MAG: 2,5-diamino-6-ribosylamino-4(3H)-pyrimidinone 5'-phosphate reductase [bacterium ADurb.Bin212]
MIKPRTQLYMLMSLDGKISTGSNDSLDFDQDLPKITGVKEGLHQYYDIEKSTDINSFNTGRVMAKIGMNKPSKEIDKIPVTFIIADNSHLTLQGVINLCKRTKRLYLVTANKHHPAFSANQENLEIIFYEQKIDFIDLWSKLGSLYGMKRVTVQSGGNINALLLRDGLIDKVSVVIAPLIIGGKDTSTLVDGQSFASLKDLSKIVPLELISITKLKKSYLHLQYRVKK